jgi:RNA polymerase sigma factor (sigma-70 family)
MLLAQVERTREAAGYDPRRPACEVRRGARSVEPGAPDDLLATDDLVARAKGHEAVAAEELFRRYRPRLQSFVHARVPVVARKLSDTQDVVQDVCFKILRALDRFESRGIGSFWWFARQIAKNHLLDLVRRGRALHETGLDEKSDAEPVAKARAPAGVAADRESAEAFDRALERVADPVRQGLVMRLELGLEWNVIARDCGFPSPDAARVAVKRALGDVAKEMAGHGEGS